METQNVDIIYVDDRHLGKIADKRAAKNNLKNHIEYDENGTGFKDVYDELKNCDTAKSVLKSLIHELPAVNKKVLLLKFWENLSNDEIAYKLRITRSRVKKSLDESYRLLRKKLISELYEEVTDVA